MESIYNANTAITADNIEPLLELSRKYDVADIRINCTRFFNTVPLSSANLPQNMTLACTYGIDSAIQRYESFIASSRNLDELNE